MRCPTPTPQSDPNPKKFKPFKTFNPFQCFQRVLVRQRAFSKIEVPEYINGTTVFFASPDNDFMTGQLLVLDSGEILN